MKIVDANVMLYAVNRDAEHHQESRVWLDAAVSGGATVGFSWLAMLAFLRLSTKLGLFPAPLTVDEAMARLEAWTEQPTAQIVHPTGRHASVLARLLRDVGVGANLVNDAHLAALSIEHRGTVVSYDNDFSRFPDVKWERPTTQTFEASSSAFISQIET